MDEDTNEFNPSNAVEAQETYSILEKMSAYKIMSKLIFRPSDISTRSNDVYHKLKEFIAKTFITGKDIQVSTASCNITIDH